VARLPAAPDGPGRKPSSWRSIGRLTALAASLAVAFALGWTWHGRPAENAPDALIAGSVAPPPMAPEESPSPAPQELAAGPAPPPEVGETGAPLDPVVRHWEHRGYRAERQTRQISMQLKDGRKLEVPVEEIRIRYVGDRTY